MQSHAYVAIVTVMALLTYAWMGVMVGRERARSGIKAPATTGDERLERAFRAHYNTLEWMPIFLAGLWLFALYWNDLLAAAVGLVWILGRILYQTGYVRDPAKREVGFLVQAAAAAVLLFGAFGGAVYALMVTT